MPVLTVTTVARVISIAGMSFPSNMKYLTTSACNDRCLFRTDYFLIAAVNHYDDWKLSDSIDCTSTQSCAHAKASQQQSCTTFGWSASATISTSVKAGVGSFELTDQYTINAAVNGNVQQCEQTTNTEYVCKP